MYSTALAEPLSPGMEQLVLFTAIGVFATALLFFLMTLSKRIWRIGEERKRKEYLAFIENILFKHLFEDLSTGDILKNSRFSEMAKDPLFKRVAVKAIISLHDNYSGTYSKKLEKFFEESGLASYSVAKLESVHWSYIVEGVRDLSTLNQDAYYSRIASRITHSHELVKTEVLLALIKMRGIEEIMKFQKTGLVLNDWIQSNILYVVKKHRIPAPQNLNLMLKSPNRTIVLLAVRLINYYRKAEHQEVLFQFFQETKDRQLKQEISEVLEKTEFVS